MNRTFLITMLCFFLFFLPFCNKTPTTPETPIINLPIIVYFNANPNEILYGDSSTLSWKVTNADKVEIDNGIGSVWYEDSTEISPEETTYYTLSAVNKDGKVTKTVGVKVNNGANVKMTWGPQLYVWGVGTWWFSFEYRGTIKNIGNKTAYDVKVWIYLYDSNNNLLDSRSQVVSSLDLWPEMEREWSTRYDDYNLYEKHDKNKTEYKIEWNE